MVQELCKGKRENRVSRRALLQHHCVWSHCYLCQARTLTRVRERENMTRKNTCFLLPPLTRDILFWAAAFKGPLVGLSSLPDRALLLLLPLCYCLSPFSSPVQPPPPPPSCPPNASPERRAPLKNSDRRKGGKGGVKKTHFFFPLFQLTIERFLPLVGLDFSPPVFNNCQKLPFFFSLFSAVLLSPLPLPLTLPRHILLFLRSHRLFFNCEDLTFLRCTPCLTLRNKSSLSALTRKWSWYYSTV